jgi:hypothetical protein
VTGDHTAEDFNIHGCPPDTAPRVIGMRDSGMIRQMDETGAACRSPA